MMKKKFVVKLAVAAVLALGSMTQAQDEVPAIPAVDAPVPVPSATAEGQQSVSDNVVVEGEVAPVAPIAAAPIQEQPIALAPSAAVGSSCCGQAGGCAGCSQSSPVFTSQMISAPLQGSCSSCNSCSSCGVAQAAPFAQAQYIESPVAFAGGQCCGSFAQGFAQIGQVTFQQPISSVPTSLASTPTSVISGAIGNPAPLLPTTQVLSPGCGGCSSPVTTYSAAPTVACNTCNTCDTCQPGRVRLFRGRLFRNR